MQSVFHPDRWIFPAPGIKFASPFFNSAPYPVGNSPGCHHRSGGWNHRPQLTDAFRPGIQTTALRSIRWSSRWTRLFRHDKPNLNVNIPEGRWALSQLEHTYQIITSMPSAHPNSLARQRLNFREVRAHLAQRRYGINIGRSPTDRQVNDALTATIQRFFRRLHHDLEQSLNSILFATVQPRP